MFYHDPFQALAFINKEYSPNHFTKHFISLPEEEYADHRIVDINIRKIRNEIYNPRRFEEISVIVGDFSMPGLNGLDLFKQINYPFIKKILLTGEGDSNLAVEAFNKGIIDKFILKNTRNLTEVLKREIYELQSQFFCDISEIVISALTKNPSYPSSCLDDPMFINFFYDFCQQNKIIEYYLLDAQGGYLLIDAHGKPSWLCVANEKELEGYALLLEDDDASSELVHAVRTKKQIPCLFSEADFNERPANWQRFLHPAKKLEGRVNYFYAYIDNPNQCKL